MGVTFLVHARLSAAAVHTETDYFAYIAFRDLQTFQGHMWVLKKSNK